MKFKSFVFYFYFLLFFIPLSSSAQFTYVDLGITQSKILMAGKSLYSKQTRVHVTEFNLGGLVRFRRHLGIGLDLGIPIAQKSAYSFRGGRYEDNLSTGIVEDRYKPQEFEYTIRQSAKLKLIGRVYFGVKSNWFLDLRVSALKLKSNLVLERAAQEEFNNGNFSYFRPALEAVSIHEKQDDLFIIPGLAIGFQPHLGERFFMNFNLGFDFYTFKGDGFSYSVPWETYYSNQQGVESLIERVATITSPPAATKLSLSGNIRFGMFF